MKSEPDLVSNMLATSRRRRNVRTPSTVLFIANIVSSVFVSIALVSTIAQLAGSDRVPSGYFLGASAYGVVLVAQVIQSVGAAKMLRFESYRWAWVSAGIGLCPILTPCIIVGIPFAFWAAILLARPEYRALYRGQPPYDESRAWE